MIDLYIFLCMEMKTYVIVLYLHSLFWPHPNEAILEICTNSFGIKAILYMHKGDYGDFECHRVYLKQRTKQQ